MPTSAKIGFAVFQSEKMFSENQLRSLQKGELPTFFMHRLMIATEELRFPSTASGKFAQAASFIALDSGDFLLSSASLNRRKQFIWLSAKMRDDFLIRPTSRPIKEYLGKFHLSHQEAVFQITWKFYKVGGRFLDLDRIDWFWDNNRPMEILSVDVYHWFYFPPAANVTKIYSFALFANKDILHKAHMVALWWGISSTQHDMIGYPQKINGGNLEKPPLHLTFAPICFIKLLFR